MKNDSSIKYNITEMLSIGYINDKIDSINRVTNENNTQVEYCIELKDLENRYCSICGSKLHSKGNRTKTFIHQTTYINKQLLNIKYKRYSCSNNDCTATVVNQEIPIRNYKNLTIETVFLILESLKSYSSTFVSVADKFLVDPKTIKMILDDFCNPVTRRLPEVLCIDDKNIGCKGNPKFATVLVDFKTNEVIEIYPSRKSEQLSLYLKRIKKAEREAVLFASIDMSYAYKSICQEYFPNALICVDKFHVVSKISNALYSLMLSEKRKIRTKIESNKFYNNELSAKEYALDKLWHILLKKDETFSRSKYAMKYIDEYGRYNSGFDAKQNNKKTYHDPSDIKELMLSINDDITKAYNFYQEYLNYLRGKSVIFKTYDLKTVSYIIAYIRNMKIEAFNVVANTFENWTEEIVNSFTKVEKLVVQTSYKDGKLITHKRRPKVIKFVAVSNGPIESVNAKIKYIQAVGRGYKNFEILRKLIFIKVNRSETVVQDPLSKKYYRLRNVKKIK